MNLEKSERFQKEYNDFRDRISKITDDKLKIILETQLKNLLNEVKSIDLHHAELLIKNTLPVRLEDTKSNLAEIRRKLDKTLRDWERANS